jgi:hypothetical protein
VIVAPLVAVGLGLVLAVGAFAAQTVNAQTFAASAARQLSRGASEKVASSALEETTFELDAVRREKGMVCAQVRSRGNRVPLGTSSGVFSLIPLQATGRACAALEPV